MSLEVYYEDDPNWAAPENIPPSWVVNAFLQPQTEPSVVAFGFARRKDAEIAARILPETGIDFGAPYNEFSQQWIDFGGRDAIRKFVCERLQW